MSKIDSVQDTRHGSSPSSKATADQTTANHHRDLADKKAIVRKGDHLEPTSAGE